MNARRGLFRIWIVASGLWIIGVALVAFQMSPSLPPAEYLLPSATSDFFELNSKFNQFDSSFMAIHSKIEFPNNVLLFVHKDVPKAAMETRAAEFAKTYPATRGEQLKKLRVNLGIYALLAAFIPSLAVLLAGMLVGWISNGFKGDTA